MILRLHRVMFRGAYRDSCHPKLVRLFQGFTARSSKLTFQQLAPQPALSLSLAVQGQEFLRGRGC